ncbi:hypothetical protein DMUE_2152 [Dictyocoela muelleri]|nr:hypothetical protein DMUE_2152 [Dictyocoela muelleri]
MYKYIKEMSFIEIAYQLSLDRQTVSSYSDLVIEIICDHVIETSERIGGYDENNRSKIVEIDESLFFKRKYNRGRIRDGQWYVGGIERGTKKHLLFLTIIGILNND